MLFGMLATRAMALVRLGQLEEAADWAIKAAARPNVFPHIHAIAAFTPGANRLTRPGACLCRRGAQDGPPLRHHRISHHFPIRCGRRSALSQLRQAHRDGVIKCNVRIGRYSTNR